eukprot:6205395-Pleurochrysis_carterae.AAC.2
MDKNEKTERGQKSYLAFADYVEWFRTASLICLTNALRTIVHILHFGEQQLLQESSTSINTCLQDMQILQDSSLYASHVVKKSTSSKSWLLSRRARMVFADTAKIGQHCVLVATAMIQSRENGVAKLLPAQVSKTWSNGGACNQPYSASLPA